LTNLLWKLNNTTLATFAYQLDVAGNRTNMIENLANTNRAYAWVYDFAYRLINETFASSFPTGSISYTLDDVGNRTGRGGSGPITNFLPPTAFSYSPNDWIITDAYDANGNTLTNGLTQTYLYDFENHLTNFNGGQIILVYNADGYRVKKVAGGVTTLYLVDSQGPGGYARVLEELTLSGTNLNLAQTYVYGLSLISQRSPGVATNFFGFDGQYSTRFLIDTSGTVGQNTPISASIIW
jgi:hypothetical protein